MASIEDPEAVEVDSSTLKAAVTALDKGGVAAATSMLDAATKRGGDESALLVLAEVSASSSAAAAHVMDAGCVTALLPLLSPSSSSRSSTELALRLLCAISTQPNVTERMLKEGLLPPLLSLTHTATESIGVRVAVLLHNLADTPGSRFRLMHGRTLTVLTHMLLNPSGSGALKEHALQAVASLAGSPTAELSFPQLLGNLCAAKMPGTQREAMTCLQLIVEKTPEHAQRLGTIEEIARGLAAAAASSDAQCASDANDLRARLGLS